ncbi:unnamed protein product [Rhizoctonia solani]|uniref:DUF6533 domain-containing protein n=1 Tax=Rhizoctonia solani TaxID=456999 RepID=A0A8H3GFV7_9AGAM|nr:unnamed protein product [Rhizoctonia solani]
MELEELSYAVEVPIAGDILSGLEEIENLAIGMEATRYLALASLSFLLYDIASTIDLESKYVWSAPWNFGRIAFHFNRVFAPLIQILHLISLFRFRPSPQFCIITSGIYVWGTCIIVAGVMSVLIARVWLLYFRKPWVLILLLTLGALVSLPPILVILIAFKEDASITQNPAPDVIPGCLFGGLSKWSWVAYLGSTLYETLLFALTVYKVYTAEYELPIINRLYRDGTCYFVAVLGSYLCHALHMDTNAILFSRKYIHDGWFEDPFNFRVCNRIWVRHPLLGSTMSTMCSRMLLSTKSFESERHERIREQAMSISETIRVPRFRRNQGSNYWGIIEVDRTRLHIANNRDRDSELGEAQGIAAEEARSRLAPLPVMDVPGAPGLRSGWIRRDSEGEIVVH